MAIKYNDISDTQKHTATDILLKIEAIDGALANIQTVRAEAEIGYAAKEQTLQAEKNKLIGDVRKIRTAEIV